MKLYKVVITEKLQMTVEVEADSRMEAEKIASDQWLSGEHVLDAECFKDVNFRAALPERERREQ